MKLGSLCGKTASDLVRDPFYASLETTYFLWHGALLLAVTFAGWAWGGWYMAGSFVAYGFFLRMLLLLHATWMVNSLTHMWGYRSYQTKDQSRNNPLVGLLAQGEGWHNNHHHYQASVNHGHRWWELDFTFLVILLLACASLPLSWIGLGTSNSLPSDPPCLRGSREEAQESQFPLPLLGIRPILGVGVFPL